MVVFAATTNHITANINTKITPRTSKKAKSKITPNFRVVTA